MLHVCLDYVKDMAELIGVGFILAVRTGAWKNVAVENISVIETNRTVKSCSKWVVLIGQEK